MFKEFLKQKGISIYQISKTCGIPYSTLNDMVNQKVDIKNIRAGIVYELARMLRISMDEVYQLCSNEIVVYSDRYSTEGRVFIKNKTYTLEFQYHNRVYKKELYPVKREATMFIESIAMWEMEERISDWEMEEIYELCVKAKR